MTQLQINVSPEQLAKFSENIVGIFDSLSTEDKKDVAKQVMAEWLRDPIKVEESIKEKEVLAEMRKDYSYNKDKSDEQLRGDYQFRDKMKGFKTSKEKLVESISKEVTTYYQTFTTDAVKNDPQFKKLLEEISDDLKGQLPVIMQKAMLGFFMNQMSMWQHDMANHLQMFHPNH